MGYPEDEEDAITQDAVGQFQRSFDAQQQPNDALLRRMMESRGVQQLGDRTDRALAPLVQSANDSAQMWPADFVLGQANPQSAALAQNASRALAPPTPAPSAPTAAPAGPSPLPPQAQPAVGAAPGVPQPPTQPIAPPRPEQVAAAREHIQSALAAPPPDLTSQRPAPSGPELDAMTERSQDDLGVPHAVRGREQWEGDMERRASALKTARLHDAIFRGLGLLTMGVGQMASGPKGLPDARLLASMVPDPQTAKDLQGQYDQQDAQGREEEQRGAQERTRLDQQGFQHTENDANRQNQLRIAQMLEQGRGQRAEETLQGREADRGQRGQLAADANASRERVAALRRRARGAGGAAHVINGMSEQDQRDTYANMVVESSGGGTTLEQARQQVAALPMGGPRGVTAGISSGLRTVAGGHTGAATQERDTQRRGQHLSDLDVTQRRQYAQALDHAGIPEAHSRLDRLSGLLEAANDDEVRQAIGVLGHPDAMAVAPTRVASLAQAISGVENVALKERSGTAVTPPEFARFRSEIGNGSWLSAAPLRNGIQAARSALQAREDNLRQGFGQPAPAAAGGTMRIRRVGGGPVMTGPRGAVPAGYEEVR